MPEVASRMNARPAYALGIAGVNRKAQRAEERVLGGFHVAEEIRKVNDTGHIGLGELDLPD
jgi:hypothetical protein